MEQQNDREKEQGCTYKYTHAHSSTA